VDEKENGVEFWCFLLVLDPPFIMSSFTFLVDSIASYKVHRGIFTVRIFSFFRNLD
jgi:hypothetical protein